MLISRRAVYVAAFFVVCTALLAPIWLVAVPPCSDLLNHLARVHVLAHLSDSEAYRQLYEARWGPYPNLAFDLIGIALVRLVALGTVAKVFLTIVVLLWCTGCVALGRAIEGRDTYRPLVACFFVYNEHFLLGYASFMFGMAVAVWTLALFVAFRPRWTWPRRLAIGGLSIVVAASHAAALITLLVAVGAWLLGALVESRRADARGFSVFGRLVDAARELAVVLPGLMYLVVWMLGWADHGQDRAASHPITSTRALVESVIVSYDGRVDRIALAALAVAAVLGLVRWSSWRVRWPALFAAVAVTLLVYVMPADYAGGFEANGRYVLGAWTLALFAVQLGPAASTAWLPRAALALALCALGLRHASIARSWLGDLEPTMNAQLVALEAVPQGAAVHNMRFATRARPSRSQRLRDLALLHVPALTAVTRAADVPTLYAIPGVQPLRHRSEKISVHRFKFGDEGPFEWERIQRELDVVWICSAPPPVLEALASRGRVEREAGECKLVMLDAP